MHFQLKNCFILNAFKIQQNNVNIQGFFWGTVFFQLDILLFHVQVVSLYCIIFTFLVRKEKNIINNNYSFKKDCQVQISACVYLVFHLAKLSTLSLCKDLPGYSV